MKEMKCLVLIYDHAELKAVYDEHTQNEDIVFTYKGAGGDWSFTYGDLRLIWVPQDFSVSAESDKKGYGTFSIGPRKKWLYSHELFSNPDDLYLQIKHMIQFALTGSYQEEVVN